MFGRNRPEGKVLEPVGVFEAPKHHGKYETGQVSGGHSYLILVGLTKDLLTATLL